VKTKEQLAKANRPIATC